MATPPRPRARRSFRAIVHPKHRFWGPILNAFARLWIALRWFFGTVIFGTVVLGAFAALAVTGSTGLPDPHKWPILQPIFAAPIPSAIGGGVFVVVTLFSWIAYRIVRPEQNPNIAIDFVVDRVEALKSALYVPRYVEAVYLDRRDVAAGGSADDLAVSTLQRLAKGPDPMGKLGICVFGRPTLGKTRLAWEAMRAALSDWTFVRWPHGTTTAFDFAAHRGQRVVLWLDDLHQYARANEAPALRDLAAKFAQAGARLIVVATCRDGDDLIMAREQLGDLLRQLVEVRPADLESQESQALIDALQAQGEDAVGKPDGTPGGIILGVEKMREERYPRLSPDAKRIMQAMKLLYLTGIYDSPEDRVHAVAQHLFNWSPASWREVRGELIQQDFLRSSAPSVIEPMANVYLEAAISNYPEPGRMLAEDWPQLQTVLMQRQDASALINMGIAWNAYRLGDPRSNNQRAEACYRAALQVHSRSAAPFDWATTQNNLGEAFRAQAAVAEGAEQAVLLGQAVEAFRATLGVYSRTIAPLQWAGTQNNLGAALSAQAAMAEGAEQAALLGQAVEAFRAALEESTRTVAPLQWAATQNNLGAALSDQAVVAEGAEQAALLGQAVETFRAALEESTRTAAPFQWAMTQNNLGAALRAQTAMAEGAEQTALLNQAVEAYRAALEVSTRTAAPFQWAMTQNNLGAALRAQAAVAEGAEQVTLLGQAVEAYRATLEVYSRSAAPFDWAMTQNNLGEAFRAQVAMAEGAEQATLLGQAVEAFRAALQVRTRSAAPFQWAATQNSLGAALRAQAAVAEGAEQAALLGQAVETFRAALEVYTRTVAPLQWAAMQNNLGAALRDQATVAEGAEQAALLGQAVEAFRAALEVRTRSAAPFQWAGTQFNLALLYRDIGGNMTNSTARCAAFRDARTYYDSTLEVFTIDANPAYHRYAIQGREQILQALHDAGCEQ